MCGIAGIHATGGVGEDAETTVLRMLAAIRYRGPDQYGTYIDEEAALGNVRLSIVDLGGGQQPIANRDESLWIVFNGEVFNHIELRAELESCGHTFSTRTDTEVVLHAFEEFGPGSLSKLNGDFAFAIWDRRTHSLFLARDRIGVRPLYYHQAGGTLYFGSEVKALLNALPRAAEIDPGALLDVFTYWAPLPGRSMFRGVCELPPGHYLTSSAAGVCVERYWALDFPTPSAPESILSEQELLCTLEQLLEECVRIRLRSDVPVGAYLSGGLDSSLIASLIRDVSPSRLCTFSVAFADTGFDERKSQERMSRFLGTHHEVIEATHVSIGDAFPRMIWHTEVPTLRTAPVPMFLLSQLVQRCGFKVVLTGEGADEFFGGYDLFKEAKIRAFWSRDPRSTRRPKLLERLYPDVFAASQPGAAYLAAFFRHDLEATTSSDFSHSVRWRNSRRTWRFLTEPVTGGGPPASPRDVIDALAPARFASWKVFERAQFIEATTFLPQYLLSTQGDRVAMAHSVEGRFPFLDPRLIDFATRLPTTAKMRGLQEKTLLRKVASRRLPGDIAGRGKKPYRAPIHRSFFHSRSPDYVAALLDDRAIHRSGWFRPLVVRQLREKLAQGKAIGESDEMALAGILSTQLLQLQFVDSFRRADPLSSDGAARSYRRSLLRSVVQ